MNLIPAFRLSVFIAAATLLPNASFAGCSSKVINGATYTKCDPGSSTKVGNTVFYKGADTGENNGKRKQNFNLNTNKKNTRPVVIGNSVVYRPDKNGNGYTGLPEEIGGALYTNLKNHSEGTTDTPTAVRSGATNDINLGDTKVYNTSPIIMNGKVTNELPNQPGITFYRDGGDNSALKEISGATPPGITDDVADALKEEALERVGE